MMNGKNDRQRAAVTLEELWSRLVDKIGLNGGVLKIIALVTMLIDHAGATLVEYKLDTVSDYNEYMRLAGIDDVLRGIGRIAFPLFAFMLVEGFFHTKNRWKYLLRIAIFAFISEVPFDLAVFHKVWYPEYQNIFFTLALSFGMLMCLEKVKTVKISDRWPWLNTMAVVVFDFGIYILFSMPAHWLCVDYDIMGLAVVLLFYAFRNVRFGNVIGGFLGCFVFLQEPKALFCLIPIALYNGKRGPNLKWLFYIIYPVHMLLYWLIAKYMGIA